MSGADLKDTLRQGGRIFGTMISINPQPALDTHTGRCGSGLRHH